MKDLTRPGFRLDGLTAEEVRLGLNIFGRMILFGGHDERVQLSSLDLKKIKNNKIHDCKFIQKYLI